EFSDRLVLILRAGGHPGSTVRASSSAEAQRRASRPATITHTSHDIASVGIIEGLLGGSSSYATWSPPGSPGRAKFSSRVPQDLVQIVRLHLCRRAISRNEDQTGVMKNETDQAAAMVLVVEDEAALSDVVQAYLAKDGYATASARSGPEAVEMARALVPDVIVLDLGLPGLDGLEVMRRIRTFSDCYVLITTARSEEVDRLVGLSVGADDYLTKPFSVRELVARVQAVLRRPRADSGAASSDTVRTFGELEIDTAAQEVRLASRPLPLTPTERGLLMTLALSPGQAFSRRQLMEAVWGDSWIGDDHLVDVHIANLRRKLDES